MKLLFFVVANLLFWSLWLTREVVHVVVGDIADHFYHAFS